MVAAVEIPRENPTSPRTIINTGTLSARTCAANAALLIKSPHRTKRSLPN